MATHIEILDIENLKEISSIDELCDQDYQLLKKSIVLRLEEIKEEKEKLKKKLEHVNESVKTSKERLDNEDQEREKREITENEKVRNNLEKLNRIIPNKMSNYRKCVNNYLLKKTILPYSKYLMAKDAHETDLEILKKTEEKIKEIDNEEAELILTITS